MCMGYFFSDVLINSMQWENDKCTVRLCSNIQIWSIRLARVALVLSVNSKQSLYFWLYRCWAIHSKNIPSDAKVCPNPPCQCYLQGYLGRASQGAYQSTWNKWTRWEWNGYAVLQQLFSEWGLSVMDFRCWKEEMLPVWWPCSLEWTPRWLLFWCQGISLSSRADVH